jgi:hypothetical protein
MVAQPENIHIEFGVKKKHLITNNTMVTQILIQDKDSIYLR